MAEKTVKDTGEFGCIRKITHGFINRPEWVKLGSGDDCAVYTVPDGMDELISTDKEPAVNLPYHKSPPLPENEWQSLFLSPDD